MGALTEIVGKAFEKRCKVHRGELRVRRLLPHSAVRSSYCSPPLTPTNGISVRVAAGMSGTPSTAHLERTMLRSVGKVETGIITAPSPRASTSVHPPAISPDRRARSLGDGTWIPLLGLGVWQVPNGPECEYAVRWALELGYRHIDTAQAYGNEESVGRALRASGVPREEVFLTTKFHPGRKDPARAAARSLERLGVDHVDLYIIHWPKAGATWAWPGMEQARDQGFARSIGVSNYSVQEVDQVLAIARHRPVVDQVQFSPLEYRRRLLEACDERGMAVEAYSPLGTGRHVRNPDVIRIAQRAGRTPAQVLLRWCLQRGTIALVKSTHRGRLEENAQAFDFELFAEDMRALDALDRTGGTDRAREQKWW
jgi:diketogulonate reductase-like aldo/keto reductase